MRVKYLESFKQAFRLLENHEKDAVLETIALFEIEPFAPSLHNHPLRNTMSGTRAISVTDDIRIIFREKGGYTEILMLDVGSHERVYGM